MTGWGGALGHLAQQVGQSALGAQIMGALGPAVNQPLSADEIRQALGNQTLQEMAKSLGIPVEQIADVLAKNLLVAVDQASPNGVLDPKAAG